MSSVQLLRLGVLGESDVFLLRQRGREVSRAVGLDLQDQIRVATALSDLGRDVLSGDTRVSVEFYLVSRPCPALRIRLHWRDGDAIRERQVGWVSATRLLTDVRAECHGDQRVINLIKRLPANAPSPTPEYVAKLRARLATLTRGSALDELRVQNEELLVTLETLERKQSELLRLNAELEETNRGVLALYGELSDELEETNRGVVALYAELDDKSTQLKEAGEAKTRFWANISHELRTPINSVIGLTGLLLGAGADPLTAEQRYQIQMIKDSGETLLALVNELLEAAKVESGRQRPLLAAVDLRALFAQLRDTLRPTVPITDVSLVIADPPLSPVVVTDETMLSRILRNLLANGLKFTERGEVRLDVHYDDGSGSWEFLVADTGVGIPLDQQKLVFEEFHQVPSRLQARTGGTGLGLPYARKLADLLDGTLELRSTPGKGTEVLLRLPARHMDAAASDHWGNVLVVDGDEVFRAGLRDMIIDRAATVHDVADGRTAVSAAVSSTPDLIFVDLNMPELDGYDCVTALRKEPALTNVPIIVVTSTNPEEIDHAALGSGVVVLLRSGLSRPAIQDAVRRARQAARIQGEP